MLTEQVERWELRSIFHLADSCSFKESITVYVQKRTQKLHQRHPTQSMVTPRNIQGTKFWLPTQLKKDNKN